MNRAPTPGIRLSIVIAAWNGAASLERCLQSIRHREGDRDIEVLAVTNFPFENRYSNVRHISMPAGTTVPLLRTAGTLQSVGEIVALAEDHCTFAEDWIPALLKEYQSPHSVVGGPVENASIDRSLDWAMYFYDYGKFMLPFPPGITQALSGNNVSFRRTVLFEVQNSFDEGFFEPFVFGEVQRRGYPLYLTPEVIVYHQKTYRFRSALSHCYHLGRGYAALRVSGATTLRRTAMGTASLALPVLLTGRTIGRVFGKRRLIPELLRSLPYLFILTSGWSFGEFSGYLAGAGRSTGQWK